VAESPDNAPACKRREAGLGATFSATLAEFELIFRKASRDASQARDDMQLMIFNSRRLIRESHEMMAAADQVLANRRF